MFAYCRNNPITRTDISGTADYDCVDDSPLDEEDILHIGEGGGGEARGNYSYAIANNPIDAGYSFHVDLSQAANSSSFHGGLLSNGYSIVSSVSNPDVANNSSPKFNADQRALLELVKERKSGMSMAEARILVEWGSEYGFMNNRIDLGHENGSNQITRGPHLHLGPYNHIRIN